jgi:hypothetical protein
LRLLILLFVPEDAPIVVGIDETIERRRGAKIAAKGIYRDPVRSSKEFFVKTSGLRWMSMMLLTPILIQHNVSGPCPFLPCLPLLNATISTIAAAIKSSPIGDDK